MGRAVGTRCLIAFVCLLIVGNAAPAFGQGFVNLIDRQPPPSNLRPGVFPNRVRNFPYTVACYSIHDGLAQDCPISLSVTGLKDNGGHNHDVGTHPLVFPADAALAFSGDTDPAPLIVVGQTRMAEARIDHPLPEVAGVIETFLVMNTPPGWICVTSCFSPRQWHFRYTLDVGVRNLEPFPDEGVSYKTIRRPRDIERHPKGSYGTSATLRRLQSIVDYYFDITAGQRLSLNDISLPKGGLFDFESPWAPPHKSHREGLAVDINTVNVNGISTACDIALPEGQRFNFDVMLAIALANRPVPNVAAPPGVAVAQCHGGHIHIDFPRSR